MTCTSARADQNLTYASFCCSWACNKHLDLRAKLAEQNRETIGNSQASASVKILAVAKMLTINSFSAMGRSNPKPLSINYVDMAGPLDRRLLGFRV